MFEKKKMKEKKVSANFKVEIKVLPCIVCCRYTGKKEEESFV